MDGHDTLVLPHAMLVARLRARVRGRARRRIHAPGFRPAAVAILLHDLDGITHVTLTRRASHLRTHAGQISLPGGVRDAQDPSFVATALRESQEELGVDPGLLDVIGLLDDEPTTSGFLITPVVATLARRPLYAPNPDEVAQVIDIPLAVFGDRAGARDLGESTLPGQVHRIREYRYHEHRITGATARILEGLEGLAHARAPS